MIVERVDLYHVHASILTDNGDIAAPHRLLQEKRVHTVLACISQLALEDERRRLMTVFLDGYLCQTVAHGIVGECWVIDEESCWKTRLSGAVHLSCYLSVERVDALTESMKVVGLEERVVSVHLCECLADVSCNDFGILGVGPGVWVVMMTHLFSKRMVVSFDEL